MPIKIDSITQIHFELSSLCNARCPLCPRNFFSYPLNSGYTETNISLDLIKKSFNKDFILQLKKLLINGNFGDMVSNLETVEIFRYFLENNPNLEIVASTNGSARNKRFWQELGELGVTVEFCLDGLEDTHKLYRIDTDWQKIIDNAKIFINSGGKATWKMIRFNHNKHQIDECKKLAMEFGFLNFHVVDEKRDTGPVFNKDGTISHTLGNYKGPQNLKDLLNYWENISINKFTQFYFENNVEINCYSKNSQSIYVSAEGKVYPCCFLGFHPQNYKGTIHKLINEQIKLIEENNDLHKNDLKTALKWFDIIEQSWTKENTHQGRLIQCDYVCGSCEKSKSKRNVDIENLQ